MDQLKEQAMHATQSSPSRQITDTDPESDELKVIPAEDITVAIFCALPCESAAVKYTLDKEFGCRPKTIGPRKYVYSFGLIGEHKVVIARPSHPGTVKAAQCAATVCQQFPNVRFALLLGIGAGIPCFPENGSKRDIRLGDVAVSIPRDGQPGVVEYDYGKYEVDGTFVLKGSLDKPHPLLISADGALQEDEMMDKDRLRRTLKRITKQSKYSRPECGDILFDETFRHVKGDDCTECLKSNEKRIVARDLKPAQPAVHRGLILSGSGVVKNPEDRLHLRRGHTDAICFEMEAAGIVDEIPCLVVRGICDYADTHKQDGWHNYAAAVAAAYGKAILLKIYGQDVQEAESMKEAMAKFDQKLDQLLVTGEETQTVVKDIQYSTNRRDIKLDMEKLPYARGAVFSSKDQDHTTCHPRTRVDLLCQIKDWIQVPNSKSIFWLNGSAGTGKSTISWTIAEWLASEGCHRGVDLGASFFFRRGEADRGSASRFFSTIVRQLVLRLPGLDGLVAAVVESDPFIFDKSLAEQFNKLLYQPLCKIRIGDCPILVVVVDALDECEKESDIKVILNLWARIHQITTVRLRLFVTSRPDLPIRLGFKNMPDATCENTSVDEYQNIILCEASRQTTIRHDISTFLDDAFSLFQQDYKAPVSKESLGHGWPGIKKMKALVDMAVPLFIVATTIYRFVTDKHCNPNDQLSKILKYRVIGSLKPMERTYLPVLEQLSVAYRNSDNEETLCDECRMIIGSIVALAEPLSKISLATLLQISLDTLEMRLDPLYSVLRVPDDLETPIRTLHLSFGEFMLSNKPQHKLQVRGSEIHGLLLTKCLQLLSGTNDMEPDGLRENLCDLRYPGQLRRDIALVRINQRLSPALQYACRYWVHHAQQGKVDLLDGCHVHGFLQKHFLQWLEAMSLINRIADVVAYLNVLLSLVSAHNSIELRAFLEDARRFVLTHRYIADLAPLQLYSSALLFIPEYSIVKKIYGKVPIWLRGFPITSMAWGPELQTLEGYTGEVSAVAFSQDGSLLASASEDSTVRLWNPSTGQEMQKLEGHTQHVNAVAFSHDSLLLASASADKTVRLWNLNTGQEVQKLEGHTGGVFAVAFSHQDGSLLASASNDKTVRLWNLNTGQEVQKLGGHTRHINAVAFFHNSSFIASMSNNRTIRLWNPSTGQELQTLQGHIYFCTAVALSQGGSLLAYGAIDDSIKLWNISTGQQVQKLQGHSDLVNAVAFSQDDSLLASGANATIRLWNLSTGQQVQMLQGHTNLVRAVAFSQNDSLLASASSDKTIRLWNLSTGQQEQTLQGYDDPVGTVAFSYDGSLLASTSYDVAIKVWNISTGQQVQTLQGHTSSVDVVAFSQDGSLLVSASNDKTVRLWNPSTGQQLQKLYFYTGLVEAVAFSQDSSLLASAAGDTVKLWNPSTGQQLQTLQVYTSSMNAVALSQDGQEVQKLEGHTGGVFAVAFSHQDGSLLASASNDKTVRLWDLSTGQEVRKLESIDHITTVSFEVDDKALVTDRGVLPIDDRSVLGRVIKPFINKSIALEDGWIRGEKSNFLWLPHEYRTGCSAVRRDTVAFGRKSGQVTFIKFNTQYMI